MKGACRYKHLQAPKKTTNRKCRLQCPNSGQQVYRARPPYLACDLAVGLSGYSRDATRKNFPGFRSKLGKELGVAHIYSACRNVNAAVRHGLIAGAETYAALNAFEFGHHGIKNYVLCRNIIRNDSTHLAVQRATLQKWIVLHLFQASRGARTLFVARSDIARGGLSFRLRFGTFEDDDVSWHDFELLSRGAILHYSSSSSSKIVDSMTFWRPEKPTSPEFLERKAE